MSDAVHIGSLSAQAREGIALHLQRLGLDEQGDQLTWVDFPDAAALCFRLRVAPDTPEVFPKGKWATVQAIETLILDMLERTEGKP